MDDLIAALPDPAVPLGPAREWSEADQDAQGAYSLACNAAAADLVKHYDEFVNRHGSVGSTRCVFDGGDVVYKVGCLQSQRTELAAFEQPSTVDGLPVARCRMVHHAGGAPIIIMETVRPARANDDIPDWAHRVDAKQVGLEARGEWVIFDAGFGLSDEGSEWSSADESHSSDGFIDHPLPEIFRQAA